MKQLSGLLIMVLLSLQTISQTSPNHDSTRIANKDLRKAALLIEQGKLTYEQLRLEEKNGKLLEQRLVLKDSSIASLNRQVATLYTVIDNNRQEAVLYQREIALYKDNIEKLERSVKRQKRKTFIVGLIGVLGISYLLVK